MIEYLHIAFMRPRWSSVHLYDGSQLDVTSNLFRTLSGVCPSSPSVTNTLKRAGYHPRLLCFWVIVGVVVPIRFNVAT